MTRTDKPWERQQGESEKAYEAFSIFRDLGSQRTVAAVSKQLGKSGTLMERWKVKYNWRERVRAYDNSIEEEARKKAVEKRKNMVSRHIGIALTLQNKALDALDKLAVEDMTPKDIKEYIRMATELERLNRELEAASTQTTTESSNSLADTIIAAYQKRKENGYD